MCLCHHIECLLPLASLSGNGGFGPPPSSSSSPPLKKFAKVTHPLRAKIKMVAQKKIAFFVLVLLSASVERFSVSLMQENSFIIRNSLCRYDVHIIEMNPINEHIGTYYGPCELRIDCMDTIWKSLDILYIYGVPIVLIMSLKVHIFLKIWTFICQYKVHIVHIEFTFPMLNPSSYFFSFWPFFGTFWQRCKFLGLFDFLIFFFAIFCDESNLRLPF